MLAVFFATHDPTTPNCQGADVGTQYRSIILHTTDVQKATAEAFIADLMKEGIAVVTEVVPLEQFHDAEEYHKDCYAKNSSTPYCQIIIAPKVEKLQQKFAELIKRGK